MVAVESILAFVGQGVLAAILGGAIYQAGEYGFWSGSTLQTKEVAQILLVGGLAFVGFATGPVFEVIQNNTDQYSMQQQLGILVVASRLSVNLLVNNWTFTDTKSIVVYLLGGALFFL